MLERDRWQRVGDVEVERGIDAALERQRRRIGLMKLAIAVLVVATMIVIVAAVLNSVALLLIGGALGLIVCGCWFSYWDLDRNQIE